MQMLTHTNTMAKNKRNPDVDFYFTKAETWQKELEELRTIVLDCGVSEELKWGCPCYTFQEKNIVLIHVFKEYCALLFFKGALLQDSNGILVQQTKNVQSARQVRFTSVQKIIKQQRILKAYINEAIEVEKAGLKVDLKAKSKLVFPEEFEKKLKENPRLKTAFNALTPGRQRAYNLYFSAAKQSKTREARIEKYLKQIMDGKGLND
jgi:uncharacterized protein YdeI (YjbR/CyaY-like superfamily)